MVNDDISNLSTKNVKSWDDSRKLLRRWRDENIRTSKDILELWDLNVASSINKFGDERWLVYEQVYIAALDCHNSLVAKDCIAALRAQYPNSLRVKRLMAMQLEAVEEYSDAIDFYDMLLEEDDTNAHIRKRKISCLKAQNKIKEYINELTDYLKTFQADHEAWLELCDAYLNELDYSKAAFCLEELILMYPHNHVYHQRFADIKYTQGNYELARSYYSYALKLNPNNVRALYGLALTTSNLKSSQKAKESSENSKISNWSCDQLYKKYKGKKCDTDVVDLVDYFVKNLTLGSGK